MENKNKKRGYYEAVYQCINCGERIWKNIPFGQPIPTMVNNYETLPDLKHYHLPAPECEHCGCTYWSHGKAER